MAEPLRFHPLVADDLEAAANWYDDISIELGNRFCASVDFRFDAVEETGILRHCRSAFARRTRQ